MAAASEAPLSARLRLSPFLGLQSLAAVRHAQGSFAELANMSCRSGGLFTLADMKRRKRPSAGDLIVPSDVLLNPGKAFLMARGLSGPSLQARLLG